MDQPPRSIDFDDVIELCGSVATSRGQALKNGGRVRDLDWIADGQVLYAAVQDGDVEPARQRITIAAHRFDGECSCPAHLNCKHVAAALLAWIDRRATPASDDDRALRDVNRWLARIVERGRTVEPALEHHEPGEPLLFYQLDSSALTQNRDGITLQILQSRLLKRGGYGKETAYRYNGHYHHPDWVTRADRAILELAVGRQADFSYRTLVVEGDIGHLLMGKLVDTGRTWWGPERIRPMTRGHTRTLGFEWHGAGSGTLRLGVTLGGTDDDDRHDVERDVERDAEHDIERDDHSGDAAGTGHARTTDWTLVPTDPPWYVLPDSGVAGPLEDVPATAVLSELVVAPPLPEAHAQTVSDYLASRLPESTLPLPRAPDFVRIVEPPRPVLVLQSKEESADIRDFYASLRFRYGDYLLPYDGLEADATLEGRTAEGRPVVLQRDLGAENRTMIEFGRRFPGFEPAARHDPSFYSRADRRPRGQDVQQLVHAWRELLDQRAVLEAEGWKVSVREPFDLSFRQVTKVEASVGETASSWFDMSLKLAHGNESFDLLPLVIEWLQSETRDRPMLLQADSGEWLEVPPEVLAPVADTLLELYETPPEDGALQLPRERVNELEALGEQWAGTDVEVAWRDTAEAFALADRLRNFTGVEPIELGPDTVRATLREYQLEGVSWLGFLASYRFNGILADDMGLGKTLQALAHVAHERAIGRLTRPALVVAPTSLLGNWRRETERFCPQLSTLVWHGADRRERTAMLSITDVVITSYALVTRDVVLLGQQDFGLVVLDEAQAIKNPAAKVTQALKTLEVRRRLCLSGTPLENHLGELWSLFDFLMPGFLGSRKRFNRLYRTPIEAHGSEDRQTALVAVVKPFLLRRRKEQVAKELPPKTEIVRTVTLEPEQARLYESIRVSMEHRVRALLAERGLGRSHIEMLDALLKLRQTCCHPRLVKLESARGVTASAKTDLVISMLEELIDEGKKILLFSQFTEMLALLERELAKREMRWVKLTGRTRDRDEVIDAFQHGDVPLFLISLKAGGTGLNLTAADTVIHYDPWWNPAVENQTSDRAHRIGQDKPVFIYKLVASDTVEEKIMAMQEHKRILADRTVDAGGTALLESLTADDIMGLFSPGGREP